MGTRWEHYGPSRDEGWRRRRRQEESLPKAQESCRHVVSIYVYTGLVCLVENDTGSKRETVPGAKSMVRRNDDFFFGPSRAAAADCEQDPNDFAWRWGCSHDTSVVCRDIYVSS